MATERRLAQAVQSAILASAHIGAYEHVLLATRACRWLGGLSSGRWRAAARDLERLEADLHRSLPQVTADVGSAATELGIEEDALWTAGDAASELAAYRDRVLDILEEDTEALGLLEADILFGATVVDDPDVPDRGTTLLFGWPEPLAPAVWPWEANWVVSDDADDDADDGGDDEEDDSQLDLFEVGDLEVGEQLLTAIAQRFELAPDAAATVLRDVAAAFTRAALLSAVDATDDDDEDEDENESSNGSP